MPDLAVRLLDDMRSAMRQHDVVRLSTIRLARAAIHNEEIERSHPLSDDEIAGVLRREVKRRWDAIEAYRAAHREDLAQREELEMTVLLGYLPQPLDEAALRALIAAAVAETGAQGERGLGAVMRAVMPRVRDRADGRTVERLAREALRAQG